MSWRSRPVADHRSLAAVALAPLKAFQRRTVDHVCARLLTDPDATRQFLVADEVGLGKTMVARGVIGRAIDALRGRVGRIDVIYICSNATIARQNLARLNLLGAAAQALPTRLTLLPLHLGGANGLRANEVNFVSLTPGTTFDLKSSTGTRQERALILRLLSGLIAEDGGHRLFRVGCGEPGWVKARSDVSGHEIDDRIAADFRRDIRSDPAILAELNDLAAVFPETEAPDALRRRRDRLIAECRARLARHCVDALEPDLIILDEFQRFHDLLKGQSDAAELARQLFRYADEAGTETKTLLLSATPYRMLTLADDDADDGDHYRDFLELMEFLFGEEEGARRREELAEEMRRFRATLQRLPAAYGEARATKDRIEGTLRRFIARTERVSETTARDAMVRDVAVPLEVRPEDLREARAVEAVAAAAGAPGTVEYWKSAPYLLSFSRGYKLHDRLLAQKDAPSAALSRAVAAARACQLDRDAIDAWKPIAPANGRMRALMDLAFEKDMDRRLWLPPSRPYAGRAVGATKALVFSAWSMVPDAIAAILSHEAERRKGARQSGHGYFDRPTTRPLQFRRADGRLAGLRALLLVVPSPTLAAAVDPLDIARNGVPDDCGALRAEARRRLSSLAATLADQTVAGERDITWDWAGPARLDALCGTDLPAWLAHRGGATAVGDEEAWPDHVAALSDAAAGPLHGETEAATVAAHLADVALGSPATCALRALSRIAPDLALDDPVLLEASARVGMGFRTLFNQPEAQSLLRAGDAGAYWRAVLDHCVEGDLQAVLDEYVHGLLESEGLAGHPQGEAVKTLASVIVSALSLRPAVIDVDRVAARDGRLDLESFKMRGRFAMRLAPHGEDESGETRTGLVRTAFNSPFRPFVLASTSVGQEGLDFHPYCHRLVHWNLPSNPVDLEQREGRVHRYKSHAVRRNVATRFGDRLDGRDPWATMFAHARAAANSDSDLEPYWLCDGPVKIERIVLALPYSREGPRLARLKRAVAVYRLAFGQPRQDDLLAWLERLEGDLSASELAELQISLRP
jgi:hypothetical protein